MSRSPHFPRLELLRGNKFNFVTIFPGRKENSISSNSSSPTSTPKNQPRPLINGDLFTENIPIDEIDRLLRMDPPEMKTSRLSKTLDEVIGDNEALAYFIQYLETVGHGALIKFILDVQSFSTAVGSADGGRGKSRGLENALNDLAMDYSLKIGGDQRRTIEKGCENVESVASEGDDCCNGGTDLRHFELEIFSRLLQSKDASENVIDAVKIYHKYFSDRAPLKIAVDPEVRQRLVENIAAGAADTTFSEVKEWVVKTLEQE